MDAGQWFALTLVVIFSVVMAAVFICLAVQGRREMQRARREDDSRRVCSICGEKEGTAQTGWSKFPEGYGYCWTCGSRVWKQEHEFFTGPFASHPSDCYQCNQEMKEGRQ